MTQPKTIPIACTLASDALENRQATALTELFSFVTETKELDNGYAFCFLGSGDMASQLFEFIQAERQCCAFFQFDLTFTPQNGPIWLSLSGDAGVKAFIQSNLPIFKQ